MLFTVTLVDIGTMVAGGGYNLYMPRSWAVFLLAAGYAWAQGDVAPEVLRLARIKQHMREVLRRQPNYVCQETVERSERPVKNKRFRLIDSLHLEVAVVDGKELFSWPGEREFKDRDVREIAPQGSFGTGGFAMHARAVFLSDAPLFRYAGEETLDGHKTARYDFSVSMLRSAFLLRVGDVQSVTAYEGSFWSEWETMDLLRLDIRAREIPPALPLRSTSDTMRYERMPIGDSAFLLPKSSDMELVQMSGHTNRNLTTFTGCRQYAGESKLSFADPDETAAEAKAREPIALPRGLTVEVELQTRIRFPGSATGDVVTARVVRDVRRQGNVVIPKGAQLTGNIAYLQKRSAMNYSFHLLAVQWREIAFDGKTGPFEGQLIDGGAIPMINVSRSLYLRPGNKERETMPHRDVFYVRKETLDIPPGLRLAWQTTGTGILGAEKP